LKAQQHLLTAIPSASDHEGADNEPVNIDSNSDAILSPLNPLIEAAGVVPLTVDLDPAIRDLAVPRQFIDSIYGGLSRANFVRKKCSRKPFLHDYENITFIPLNLYPHAPTQPGIPGLFFEFAYDMSTGSRTSPYILMNLRNDCAF
jgi:hypothetical protein